jgi:hypothetical protein
MLIYVLTTLRVENIVVPLFFMSETTQFLNFAANKNEWPVYMTIGNLCSKIRQMPSTYNIVMVTLQLILIKNRNIPQKGLDQKQQTDRELLMNLLRQVLQPPTSSIAPRMGITTFSAQIATAGVANQIKKHSLLIARRIATNIMLCGMSVFGAIVHRMKLKII